MSRRTLIALSGVASVRRLRVVSSAVFLALAAGCLVPFTLAAPDDLPAGYASEPGPYAVAVATFDWIDEARSREVPAKAYYPADGDGPFPVVVFSHGLGGTRDAYEYLGRHWASHGYVSVHVQHRGSDDSVWRGATDRMQAMRRAAADPWNALNRPRDISFAIDQLERMQAEAGPLEGRLDLGNIGVAGHSFGAYTTLAVAGQLFIWPGGRAVSLGDRRVKAAMPMSPPVQPGRDHARQYGAIRIPCFHMTGTLDYSMIGDTAAEQRRVPFDHCTGSDQYLLIFEGGDHMVFSGRARLRAGGEKDELFQHLIKMSSTAFWDAYLKQDKAAGEWLAAGGFASVLGANGTFEVRLLEPAAP